MTEHNKLPTFGETASIDETIVNDISTLKDRGFVKNTTIKSAEMNTYMKMMTNGFKGLVDTLYKQGISQNDIKANSTAEEWYSYLSNGLTNIISDSTVQKANVATKLETTRRIILTGDVTGGADFDGTSNAIISTFAKSKDASLYIWNVVASKNAELYLQFQFSFYCRSDRAYTGSSGGYQPKIGTTMHDVFGASGIPVIGYGYSSASDAHPSSPQLNCKCILVGHIFGTRGSDALKFSGTWIQGNSISHTYSTDGISVSVVPSSVKLSIS